MIEGTYAGDESAAGLFAHFLRQRSYARDFAFDLIELARDRRTLSWDLRCAAILMLESQFLQTRGDRREQQSILRRLGQSLSSAAAEDLAGRMARLRRIHAGIRGRRTGPQALGDFIHISKQPCKLTLARFLFDPTQVVERITASLRTSQGLRCEVSHCPEFPKITDRIWRELPEYEKAIIWALMRSGAIYWVAPSTSSEINSLVEYPIGTVALVVKPPGSDLEFEIKRAGVRGAHPLSAVFRRNGDSVPWPHRLNGGSAGSMLESEARAGVRLDEFFRNIHGTPAPASSVLGIASVFTVPGWRGDTNLLNYFTHREDFGDGFDAMRSEMAEAVAAFEGDKPDRTLVGEIGLTVRFLRWLAPRQATLAGTSSFRLDVMARCLSAEGPQYYFENGLGRKCAPGEARQLADDMLEEALGTLTPSTQAPDNYEAYVESLLNVPANRRRADRIYVSLLDQIGNFWGTLMGLGGYSVGETFVSRNCALRSRWVNSQWDVRICFLDHDITTLPWVDCGALDYYAMLSGMVEDSRFILFDRVRDGRQQGAVACLRQIYRPGPGVVARGAAAFRKALYRSYRKTIAAVATDSKVHRMIDPEFHRTRKNWDDLVQGWLESHRSGIAFESWSEAAKLDLATKGYSPEHAGQIVRVLEDGRDFLAEYAFLYGAKYRDFSRSYKQSGG